MNAAPDPAAGRGARRGCAAGVALALALAAAAAVAALAGGRALLLAPVRVEPGAAADSVRVRVEAGDSFHAVARRLEEARLVPSALRLRLLARLERADRGVHAGTYVFVRGAEPLAILRDLVEGNVLRHRLTIPEGWRVDQIAAEVERVLSIPSSEFASAASDSARRRAVGTRSATLEGYLFPETYYFPDGSGAGAVVDAMLARFEENWEAAADVDSIPLGLDRHEVVTLASIVEAETGVPEERSRIAAVYLNRLASGWKLQADPTVRYAIGKYDGDVLYVDLEAASPYNTYWTQGLPPGPIAAPGRAAIEAALRPLPGCDDFYFVASGGGGHVFTRTLADHERAKQAAKRAAKRAKLASAGG